MFSELGKMEAANAAYNKADEALKVLMRLDRQQSANEPRVLPGVEAPNYYPFDYGFLVK